MRHLHRRTTGECMRDDVEPLGEMVDHCNARTRYAYVHHVYQPEACWECKVISDLYTDCEATSDRSR